MSLPRQTGVVIQHEPEQARIRHRLSISRFIRPYGMNLGALVGVIALVLTACGSASRSSAVGVEAGGESVSPFLVVANDPYGSDVSENPYDASVVPAMEPLAILPLAISTSNITKYMGQVASSWSLTSKKFTVHLRRGLTWQNGRPVDAKDVVATALLDGLDGDAMWEDIAGISTPNKLTVVFDLLPDVSSYDVESSILGIYPLPVSQYGKFVPKGLMKDLVSYYKMLKKNSGAAAKSAQEKAISSAFTRLAQFHPKSVIGDGPFRLEAVTSSEVKFVRWDGSPFAKHVHVRQIDWQESSVTTNAGELLSNEADYSWTGFGASVMRRAMHTPGLHLYDLPTFSQDAIYFNNRHYPLNLLTVREAIAYVINRRQLMLLEAGGTNFFHPSVHPDLIDDQIVSRYLTRTQLDSLKTYSYDPSKAASLLRSVGFTKRHDEWYLPDGKQFTLTFDGPAGWVYPSTASIVGAKMLSSFGIKTTATNVEQPGYWTYQKQGNYQLDWGWGAGSVDPLVGMASVIGPGDNFSALGNYQGDPGIGFGPVVKVPGLGKVNVSQTIQSEAETVSPGPQMRKLVWDWARLINQQLPVIAYDTRDSPLYWSNAHYTDWPQKSNPLWAITAINVSGQGIMLMMEDGYIRPR